MVFINDILKRCEEKGHPMTRMGIYIAGKKHGFLTKADNGYDLNKEKFESWLDKAVEEIPSDYLSAKMIMKEYKVTQSESYFILNDPDCEIKKFGSSEVMYGKRESIEKVIAKRGCRHKYDW